MSRTCRRKLLDVELGRNTGLMTGRVLDVGGAKNNKRGEFRPPLDKVISWQYVNINPAAQPDFCCDAARIPVADGSFNTVIMTELLEYVESPQKVLSEAFRLLCPGGACLVSVPFMFPVHGDREFDRCRFTETVLGEYFKNAGFKIVSIDPMGSIFCVGYDMFHAAFSYASKKPQSLSCKICRKLLNIFQPLCMWADEKLFKNLSRHITTGYFAVLQRESDAE